MPAMNYQIPTYEHDPQAVLDYPIDWADWCDDLDDPIDTATAAVTVSPDDALVIDSFTHTAATGTPWLSCPTEPTLGGKYTVTMHVVTMAGREDDRSILIKIKER